MSWPKWPDEFNDQDFGEFCYYLVNDTWSWDKEEEDDEPLTLEDMASITVMDYDGRDKDRDFSDIAEIVHCTNLKGCELVGHSYTAIDISGFASTIELLVVADVIYVSSGADLESIEGLDNDFPNLKWLALNIGDGITSLDLTNMPVLEVIYIAGDGNNFSYFDIADLSNSLWELSIWAGSGSSSTNLTDETGFNFDFRGYDNLKILDLGNIGGSYDIKVNSPKLFYLFLQNCAGDYNIDIDGAFKEVPEHGDSEDNNDNNGWMDDWLTGINWIAGYDLHGEVNITIKNSFTTKEQDDDIDVDFWECPKFKSIEFIDCGHVRNLFLSDVGYDYEPEESNVDLSGLTSVESFLILNWPITPDNFDLSGINLISGYCQIVDCGLETLDGIIFDEEGELYFNTDTEMSAPFWAFNGNFIPFEYRKKVFGKLYEADKYEDDWHWGVFGKQFPEHDDIHYCTVFTEEWEVEEEYNVGDLIQYNGELYEVITAHTSDEETSPDNEPGWFNLIEASFDQDDYDRLDTIMLPGTVVNMEGQVDFTINREVDHEEYYIYGDENYGEGWLIFEGLDGDENYSAMVHLFQVANGSYSTGSEDMILFPEEETAEIIEISTVEDMTEFIMERSITKNVITEIWARSSTCHEQSLISATGQAAIGFSFINAKSSVDIDQNKIDSANSVEVPLLEIFASSSIRDVTQQVNNRSLATDYIAVIRSTTWAESGSFIPQDIIFVDIESDSTFGAILNNPNMDALFGSNSIFGSNIYNPNIDAIFVSDSTFGAILNNPNIDAIFASDSIFDSGLYNPNFGVFIDSSTLFKSNIYNPNFGVFIDSSTLFEAEELNIIPGVEVRTLADERSQELIRFHLEVIEVGQRDTAWIYFEYAHDPSLFTKFGGDVSVTDMVEISEKGKYSADDITPPELEQGKDYYYRAVGISLSEGSTGEIFNIYRGSIIRSFRTDFTVGGGRYENYIDARDLEDDDELLQRGRQRLSDKGNIMKMKMDYNEAGPFKFPADFYIGDWVRVSYTGIHSQWMRIVEVIEEETADGRFLELRFGDRTKAITDIIDEHRQEVDAELRY